MFAVISMEPQEFYGVHSTLQKAIFALKLCHPHGTHLMVETTQNDDGNYEVYSPSGKESMTAIITPIVVDEAIILDI